LFHLTCIYIILTIESEDHEKQSPNSLTISTKRKGSIFQDDEIMEAGLVYRGEMQLTIGE
jgi:hypothetical protein